MSGDKIIRKRKITFCLVTSKFYGNFGFASGFYRLNDFLEVGYNHWDSVFKFSHQEFFFNALLKHCENRKMLPWEHLIGCRDVNFFKLKYVTSTTIATVTITAVTITTAATTTVTINTVTRDCLCRDTWHHIILNKQMKLASSYRSSL